jgi:glucoamylase
LADAMSMELLFPPERKRDNGAGLVDWIVTQARRSSVMMERAISATHMARRREVLGQTVVPSAGSVLASPTIADWNPEPDYFFHWLRDSAIVMRSVADLMQDASCESERQRWRGHFENFVRFSLALYRRDGTGERDQDVYQQACGGDFGKFLRDPSELRALTGDRLMGEPRFNPDGSIDVLRWSRPQYDGPALRALSCLRYLAVGGPSSKELGDLLHLDLSFTRRHAGERCIGPWEEPGQNTHHYYVALVQLGALVHAREWAGAAAGEWTEAEPRLRADLERHWSEKHQIYMATWPERAASAGDPLDAAILLAVCDADLPDGRHSVWDPRVQVTQAALENYFSRAFPINRARSHAPALGRYPSDRYFGGGAWYPTTLAAASLYYRLAQCPGQDGQALIARGDAFMATVRDLTPAGGMLSEQVDRASGVQTSARDLTWSYAAFLGAARQRRLALMQR